MSTADTDSLLEHVLLAFAVEPSYDKATLERYLSRYPQYATDLVDLLSELRLSSEGIVHTTDDESAVQKAWDAFTATPPRAERPRLVENPFTLFQGPSFVALSDRASYSPFYPDCTKGPDRHCDINSQTLPKAASHSDPFNDRSPS
ncbi:hypothetical protein [Bradyrhizobium sp. JR3.5]